MSFLRNLFTWGGGEKRAAKRRLHEIAAAPRSRPFASFNNPFLTGMAQRLPLAELVCYTFDALQAWARERSVEREPQDTPIEFSQALRLSCPEIFREAEEVTHLYSRVAYANLPPPPESRASLERLWARMTAASTGTST